MVKACGTRLWWPLLFGDDRDHEGHVDVRVQMQLHLVLAKRADGAHGHAHFGARDWLPSLDGRFGDIGGADRAEQLTFRSGLGLELELEILEGCGAALRLRQILGGALFKHRTLGLELLDVGGGGQGGTAGRHQKIACVTGLDLDPIADLAEVRDFLQQNDFHTWGLAVLVLISVGQQGQEARAPDGELQLALVVGAGAGNAARDDLAGLGYIAFERQQVLVIDLLDVVGRETAKLLATEKTCHVLPLLPYRMPMDMSSSSPSSKSSWRRAFSSGARAIGEGSVTASSILTTSWRNTASLNRNEAVSSFRIFWSHSIFSST